MQEQTAAHWESEIAAMETAAKALDSLDNEMRARVVRWLAARFVPEQAPANRAPRPPAVMMARDDFPGDEEPPRCGGPGVCTHHRGCRDAAAVAACEPGKVSP